MVGSLRSARRSLGRRLVATALGGVMLAGLPAMAAETGPPRRLVIGAKRFTESAVLAELMAQLIEQHLGVSVVRLMNLSGTEVCFGALLKGEIDLYAEYTGTILSSLLGDPRRMARAPALATASRALYQQHRLVVLAPFGFNNAYALMMRRDRARELQVTRISDLAAHELRYGLSYEFTRRPDGMPGLRTAYGLSPDVVKMEHDLAYQALREGAVDVADAYSTDAKLIGDRFLLLDDDKRFFPPYEAVPLVREALLQRLPELPRVLSLLAGRIDDATMRQLNAEVEAMRRSPQQVAAAYLGELGLSRHRVEQSERPSGFWSLMWQRRYRTARLTGQHLVLTGMAVFLAVLVGMPLGILVSRRPRAAMLSLGGASVLQTIPSIALLAFMLPLFGIGARPAIVALFLYGLLPILRNTVTGLRAVEPRMLEVGRGLGMTPRQLLWRVELPLAVPVILAGVRTAAVINVGTATLAAFIGAGGLGEPIVTGLSVSDFDLVLSGALPAALLAVLIDLFLWGIERWATPRGLRLAQSAKALR